MPLTVTKALKLEIFNKCKLLTGQAGLNNEIQWVNILEILDDLRHIEPGEFLITTAHGFNAQTESKQQAMIELFAARKLAAMAIQTGHYLQEIPDSFIRFSEEHNIPLIEIPPEVSFKSLTRALMNELIRIGQLQDIQEISTAEKSSMEMNLSAMGNLWQEIISAENPEDLYLDLERYGFNNRDSIVVIALAVDSGRTASPGITGQPEPDLIREALKSLVKNLQHHNFSFLCGTYESYLPMLVQSRQLLDRKPLIEMTTARLLFDQMQSLFPAHTIQIGISNIRNSMDDLQKALHEAEKALQAAQLELLNHQSIISYRTMGLYRIIMDVKNIDTLREVYYDTVAPLVDYDHRSRGALMQTLEIYFQFSNILKASGALYVHRHTMRYRLDQIEKLTGLNPLLPADSFQLNLGLCVYNYLSAINRLS